MSAAHKEARDGTVEFFKPTVDTEIVHTTVTDLLAVLCEVWIAFLRPAFCPDSDCNGLQRWTSNTPHVRQCLGTMIAEVLAASFIAKTPARKMWRMANGCASKWELAPVLSGTTRNHFSGA